MAKQTLKVVILSDDGHDDDEDDDLRVLYTKPVLGTQGCNSRNPILVETYGIRASVSTGTVIDLSYDDDALQLISSVKGTKRKLYQGESSNYIPATVTIDDDDDDDSVDKTFLCSICVDEKPNTESFYIKGCSHSYCAECMAKYVSSKLQENNTNITCPVVGCGGILELQDCRSILPSQVFDRWGDALCEAMILASEKFYCPYKDCSALLVDERIGGCEPVRNTECPYCRRMFCAMCRVPWHTGFSCDEFQKLNADEREMGDILLMNLAKDKNWQRCPSCRIFVQKSAGCLFMKCRCGSRFCYKCGSHTPVDHRCSTCGT
ncbi:OLC1v1033746C1 [Oldenlandia corymbosa var. corymbosa]|uniref:RBR-type E3 ubiquitin transferase n=1 Tax=Oldenlandia corymbosa var. corymbosa TaxID=529605 RepID=A0AAV1CP36_OLDCO|nr:OLC1v1033746C1 [Oldenlandia corymbosa var. corymbosa]